MVSLVPSQPLKLALSPLAVAFLVYYNHQCTLSAAELSHCSHTAKKQLPNLLCGLLFNLRQYVLVGVEGERNS